MFTHNVSHDSRMRNQHVPFLYALLFACGANATTPAGTLGGECLTGMVCGIGLRCQNNVCIANATTTDTSVQTDSGNNGSNDARLDSGFTPTDNGIVATDATSPRDSATMSTDTTTPSGDGGVACDLFATSNTCGANLGCYVAPTATMATCLQQFPGDGGLGVQGSACTSLNECASSFACLVWRTSNGNEPGYCQRYCTTDGANDCPTASTCTRPSSWNSDGGMTVMPVTLGVCRRT